MNTLNLQNGDGDHPSRQKSGMDDMPCLDGLLCVHVPMPRDMIFSPMVMLH